MDERMRFVARLMEGEKMAGLCREFDISRKTGYKLFNRYKNSGIEGLTDRSRRPARQSSAPFRRPRARLWLRKGDAGRVRSVGARADEVGFTPKFWNSQWG